MTPTDIRSFLDLVEYYRSFVESFSSIATPLTRLTQNKKELILRQRRWLEMLKDYNMSLHYHPGKASVVPDALSRLSMGSLSHVDEEKHSLMDGQAEMMIQYLEDMLRAYVIDFGGDLSLVVPLESMGISYSLFYEEVLVEILDSSTLSYVTPYVAVHFSFSPESISDPYSICTPVGESIIATKVYRHCVVSILHRETLVDLIELDMLDFHVILGWNGFIRAMLLWIVRPERRFVESLSSIAALFTWLTQKKVMILWSNACEGILEKLKDKLTCSPVLTLSKVKIMLLLMLLEGCLWESMHVEEEKGGLVTDIYSLANLRVCLLDFEDGRVTIKEVVKSYLGVRSRRRRQVRKFRTKEIASVKVLWRNQKIEESSRELAEANMDRGPSGKESQTHIVRGFLEVDRTHSYFNLSVKLQVQVCLRIVNFWAPSDYPSLGDRLTYQGPMAGKAVKSVAKAVGGYQYPWQKNWQNARMRFQREFGVTGSLEIENLWGSVLSIELVSARKLFLLDKIGHMIQRGRKCERGRKGTSVTEYLLRNGQRQLNCCKKCLKCWLILGREGEKGK
ncbi:hypothetical protein FXO38_09090 [Capsicum annuum]|nr:hypothetical protein FXO38_09090 [Capsicum annuum]